MNVKTNPLLMNDDDSFIIIFCLAFSADSFLILKPAINCVDSESMQTVSSISALELLL